MSSKLVFLITGTSRGIGKALASYYLDLGHIIFGCSTGNATIEHANYSHFKIDLSNHDEVISLVQFVRKNSDRLDVLINNAAINPAILPSVLLPTETIKKVYDVNVITPFLLCRESVKLMKRNKFGRIINFGSMATRHEVSGESLYTSSKAALNAFTKVISKEVYQFGITANVISPSVIKTDLSEKINQNALNEVLKRNAIPNYGVTVDIINVINFVLKKESNAITGQLIYLGGV